MFPEITREDVFRLETRRMWLRWPFATDAAACGSAASTFVLDRYGQQAATAQSPTAQDRTAEAVAKIARLRQENGEGRALHLVMTGHDSDQRPFGSVSLSPLRERIEDCGLLLHADLVEDRRGSGYTTEAVQAVVDAAFMLTETPLIAASSRVLDPGFRRVLEKCGFAFCGTGLDTIAPDGSLAASDRFRLDRKAWISLKTWRVPAVVHNRMTAQPECLG